MPILTDLEDQSQGMSINVTYTYLVGGAEQTLNSTSAQYPVEIGGIAVAHESDGSIRTMQRMKSTELTGLSSSWAMASNQKYAVADDVQVYLRSNGSYYLTTLSAVNTEDYTLTGVQQFRKQRWNSDPDRDRSTAGGVSRNKS